MRAILRTEKCISALRNVVQFKSSHMPANTAQPASKFGSATFWTESSGMLGRPNWTPPPRLKKDVMGEW